MKHTIVVNVLCGGSETVKFAASELEKYMNLLNLPEMITLTLCWRDRYDAAETGIWVGVKEKFAGAAGTDADETSESTNEYDDKISIAVKGHAGVISGSNSRSVLFAVYRYLTELGCRWIRPGAEGEVIPASVDTAAVAIQIEESASYRYRGICLEGAVKVENVLDMIDWMPKVGMNSYFIQFRNGYVFFDRWYNHVNHPHLQRSGGVTEEEAQDYVDVCAAEIVKRGLIYQAVGHGWTSTPFGLPGSDWRMEKGELSADIVPFLAQVNGQRVLWEGIPLNTELCYANSEARAKMIDEIEAYAVANRRVDMLHVWLSDGYNNHCECAACRLHSPTDHYMILMNELDARLTEGGLDTKIVFLLYHELLWPPEHVHFVNPDRFVLMFAPISRSYRSSFDSAADPIGIPEYVRNEIMLPQSVADNVAFLRKWQRDFRGDGFDFDYHFMWEHQMDPGQIRISRVLHNDIAELAELGLNGLISCQVQRAFFPNGLGLTVMGRTLWQSNLPFESLVADYFASAYGADGPLCMEYMDRLSAFFFSLNTEIPPDLNPVDYRAGFEEVILFMGQFGEVIAKNKGHQDQRSRNISWEHLAWHREIWSGTLHALKLLYNGEKQPAIDSWEMTKKKLWEQEDIYQSVLDVYNFVFVVNPFFTFGADAPPHMPHYLIPPIS